MKYAEIVVNVPITAHLPSLQRGGQEGGYSSHAWLEQTFTYQIAPALQTNIEIGQLVWVPFGARRIQGIVVALADYTELEETRALQAIVEQRPLLSPTQIELARWISRRYLAPLAHCIWLLLPPGIEQKVETVFELAADAPAENHLNEKQKQLLELLGNNRALKSTRIPPNLRGAAESLVQRGFLQKRALVQPPKAKPKHIKAVRLIAEAETIARTLATLARRDLRADIIQLLSESNAPLTLDELCERAKCKPAAVRALADAGVLEILPRGSSFALTPKYFETVPALPLRQSRVCVFLREHKTPASFEEIYDATRVTPSSLRALEKNGWIQQNKESERVRLIAPTSTLTAHHSSRLENIVRFLQQEPNPVWISAVYAATGATLSDLQKLERAGIVQLETEEVVRDPLEGREFIRAIPPTLTSEQARAFEQIQNGFAGNDANIYLLHGVTGAGKTEIYLRAIEQVVKQGKQAIALVPEIALTPQTIQRFGARFGDGVGVIHSDLSYGERYDTWRRARDGKLDVVIGPRSALFAPLPQLGLIVIDEEHEPSYKQEGDVGTFRLPLYHTREVALELGRLNNASVILGSATPDVETYYRARAGEFTLLELPQRILAHATDGAPVQYQDLPSVQVVDLRAELREGNTSIFSRALTQEIQHVLAAREQIILFLNRRGSATSVVCRTCGHALRCPRCNNPYTLHQFAGESARDLVCHHCGKRGTMPRVCPNCGSTRIRPLGLGTEKLEQLVHENFPGARTLRWDWDATRVKGAHEVILDSFARGEADILIGTQMIAKGLDLPRVTLVGVINADTALNLPDFRASERTFQLLTQVAGRAGRSALGGKVIIQTYFPEHYAIAAAARHDYENFFAREIQFRRQAAYPPYQPLTRLLYLSAREADARHASAHLAEMLRDRIRRQGLANVEVIGPAPAFFAKLRGQYRYHLLLRGENARELLAMFPLPMGWRIDVDPVNVL